jgi:hypothetical protein
LLRISEVLSTAQSYNFGESAQYLVPLQSAD